MAKKSKAELVEESKALSTDIAAIRKAPHNFALLLGSDAVYLAVHKTKGTQAMKNQAKAAGGNAAKGAVGVVEMQGKLLNFTCAEGESPPGTLGKKFKTHLKERGLSFKVCILAANGSVLEGDEEDEEAQTTPEGGTPKGEDAPKDIGQKLEAAFSKFAPMLKEAYLKGGSKRKAALDGIIKTFKDSVANGEYDQALKSMNALRDALVKLAQADKIVTGTAETGGADKTALLSKAPQVDTLVKRAGSDDTFFKQAAPKLRELRGNLKAAMMDNPSDEDLAMLTKMKGKLDELFLADLAKQGHGPQRHEGMVTPEQLDARLLEGKNPQTGTIWEDATRKRRHRCGNHATKFLAPGDYVDADETVRSSAAFETQMKKSKRQRLKTLVISPDLENVLGSDYATKLVGSSRDGSTVKETDFTGGKLKAIYKLQPNGSYALLTMYPNPL